MAYQHHQTQRTLEEHKNNPTFVQSYAIDTAYGGGP
jgi:hypothetical protein